MNYTSFASLDKEIQQCTKPYIDFFDSTYRTNFEKVIEAFRVCKIASHHLYPSYGYGLGDAATAALEKVYSTIFRSEASFVRPQLITGTQALYLILRSLLKPYDTLLSLCGPPYETLQACIGIQKNAPGNHLLSQGIIYQEIDALNITDPLREVLPSDTSIKMIWIQKSCGYSNRRTISNHEIQQWVPQIRKQYPGAIIAVDNCYGELTETIEPIEAGADICAGSLLKNLGGGITSTGAYITGKKDLIDLCSDTFIAPGMGFETMPNLGFTSSFLQGLFLAPTVIREAIQGNIYMACFMELLGFEVFPKYVEPHYDIVLKIAMEQLGFWQAFANSVQECSPIDSFVRPEAFPQKGYSAPIIMAGGTFTPGSSIEFSVDGFASPPYYLYYQAGMVAEQTKYLAKTLYHKLQK